MNTRRLENSDPHITPVGFGDYAIDGGNRNRHGGGQFDVDSVGAIRETVRLDQNEIAGFDSFLSRHTA